MKILITADLHYRESWFRWLADRAADYDLFCIAGDLLDMFCVEPRIVQAQAVSRWIRKLTKLTHVAICSGNHDDAGCQISVDRAPVYEWLVALGKEPNIVTDGVTRAVDDLIVTTVPYHCSKEQKSVWLDRGSSLRRQRENRWLVLHHVPPRSGPDSTLEEREAAELLRTYRPEYFVSGHSHQFPYLTGRSWTQMADGVRVLVPGQLMAAAFPSHIGLNTESGETQLGDFEPGMDSGRHFVEVFIWMNLRGNANQCRSLELYSRDRPSASPTPYLMKLQGPNHHLPA